MHLKPQQPALGIKEQINNLKQLGLSIADDEEASRILGRISYYRLVKAYGVSLKSKNGRFDDAASFETLVSLYEFNTEFRQCLIAQIENVEIELRCRLANYLCSKYGIMGYRNPSNFQKVSWHQAIMSEVDNSIRYNSRSPFIRNFQDNYMGGDIPFYALVEILSFGTISKFFRNLKPEDKKSIAKEYDCNWPYLQSWFESLAYVRNICAHYGRLYDVRLDKTPKLPKKSSIPNNRIFGTLYCLKQLVGRDKDWKNFISKIEALLAKYPAVEKRCLGFPEDWKAQLMEWHTEIPLKTCYNLNMTNKIYQNDIPEAGPCHPEIKIEATEPQSQERHFICVSFKKPKDPSTTARQVLQKMEKYPYGMNLEVVVDKEKQTITIGVADSRVDKDMVGKRAESNYTGDWYVTAKEKVIIFTMNVLEVGQDCLAPDEIREMVEITGGIPCQ